MRLEADFVELVDALDQQVAQTDARVRRIQDLLVQIRRGGLPSDDPEIKIGILEAGSPPSTAAPPLTFVEIKSSGGLSLVTDADIRRALTNYSRNVERFTQFRLRAIRDASDPNSSFVRAISFSTDIEDLGSDNLITFYDPGALVDAAPHIQVLLELEGHELADAAGVGGVGEDDIDEKTDRGRVRQGNSRRRRDRCSRLV